MHHSHGDTTREAARQKRADKRKRKRPQLVPGKKRSALPSNAPSNEAPRPGLKFVLARLADYTDKSLLEEVRRVAALVRHPVLSISRFDAHARVGGQTVAGRFGGWHKALARAGVKGRDSSWRDNRKRARNTKRLSDEALLAILRRLSRVKGGRPVTARDVIDSRGPDPATFARRFGSWTDALKAAGLKHSRQGRHYTDRECHDNLMKVWTHLGRAPLMREMYLAPSEVPWEVYARRSGTWRRALEVFAAQANAGGEAIPGPARPKPRRKRAVLRRKQPSLHLRFRVLQRDKFKCTACGLSPAIDPFCHLHVDHVVPVSKGGRTEIGNLRTLCAYCNLGRGNRVEAESHQPPAFSPQPIADG